MLNAIIHEELLVEGDDFRTLMSVSRVAQAAERRMRAERQFSEAARAALT
jgi:hypothetical protein